MRKKITTGLFIILCNTIFSQGNLEMKINDLISQMTLEEKIELLGGTGFDSKSIDRLGIPAIKMADGPVGVRWDSSTAFPVSIAMAATWNTDLIYEVGHALGREVKLKGRDMLLAPCVNLVRTMQGGRNFESFGEDPYLTSRIALSYINGVQEEDVMACIKHYAVNNQEHERTTISAEVDERTLREIYLPAFETAVKEGKVASVMAAYNKLNGIYCAGNDFLLNKILKDDWGFDGFVVSDWGAVHSTLETAKYGVDLEMPFGTFLNESLIELVNEGKVGESIIDDKIRRMLRMIFRFHLDEERALMKDETVLKISDGAAYKTSVESMVLLKNDNNILPLQKSSIKRIAVVGPNAAIARTGGGGSSRVAPLHSISPFDALKSKLKGVEIVYEPGCKIEGSINIISSTNLRTVIDGKEISGLKGEYFSNMQLDGSPDFVRVDNQINFDWHGGSPHKNIPENNFSVRWTGKLIPGKSDTYNIGLISDDGIRLYIDGELVVNDWTNHAAAYNGAIRELKANQEYEIVIEYYENGGDANIKFGWEPAGKGNPEGAIAAAASADIALIFCGFSEHSESEGFDRVYTSLPDDQINLINEVAKVNPGTIVVLNNGGPVVLREWIDKVPAVICAWFPGQQGSNAITDILFGDVIPSGKLPYTIPKRWEDCSAYPYYPGTDGKIKYDDGLFTGYRHYDKNNIEPEFHFGYGLSYTSFEINDVSVMIDEEKIKATMTVKNTGAQKGSEVVQLYVSDKNSKIVRPLKELKRFTKVELVPGESKQVTFELTKDDLKYYDVGKGNWEFIPGDYEFLVGNSSSANDLKVFPVLLN